MSLPASEKNPEASLIGRIFIEVSLELKRLVVREAEKNGVKVNQFMANVLAKHFSNPDLAIIPRQPRGRKATLVAKR